MKCGAGRVLGPTDAGQGPGPTNANRCKPVQTNQQNQNSTSILISFCYIEPLEETNSENFHNLLQCLKSIKLTKSKDWVKILEHVLEVWFFRIGWQWVAQANFNAEYRGGTFKFIPSSTFRGFSYPISFFETGDKPLLPKFLRKAGRCHRWWIWELSEVALRCRLCSDSNTIPLS